MQHMYAHAYILFTHLSLDKMAAILADNILKFMYLWKNERIPSEICSHESNWR